MFHQILRQLNQIRDSAKSSEKQRLLAEFFDHENPHFKQIVNLILNPYITYGINSFSNPGPDPDSPGVSSHEFYMCLESLAARKQTGTAARGVLTSLVSRGVPYELLHRILNKESGAGFGVSLVNKICKGFIPTFPYMRCSKPTEVKKPLNYALGVFVQLKADGMFANLNCEEDFTSMTSRQGQPIPIESFPEILAEAKRLAPGYQYHGELEVYQDGILMPRAEGNGLVNSLSQGGSLPEGARLQYMVWDMIPLEHVKTKGRYNIKYKDRLTLLNKGLNEIEGCHIRMIETHLVHTEAAAKAIFREVVQSGREGTVEKDPDMPWIDGTSKLQIKHKMEAVCSLKIVGFRPGKGKNATTFGAIIGETSDGLLQVGVSGMDDALRLAIHKDRQKYLGTIMSVTFNHITEPSPSNVLHSLNLPRLDQLRHDKYEAYSLAEVKAAYESALLEA